MADLKFHIPVTEEVEVDRETSPAIDRSIKEADQGRTVSVEEAREMIPSWISKLESGGTLIRPHHGPNDPPGHPSRVDEPERAIYQWLANWNHQPQPFVWKATAEVILDKARRCKEAIAKN